MGNALDCPLCHGSGGWGGVLCTCAPAPPSLAPTPQGHSLLELDLGPPQVPMPRHLSGFERLLPFAGPSGYCPSPQRQCPVACNAGAWLLLRNHSKLLLSSEAEQVGMSPHPLQCSPVATEQGGGYAIRADPMGTVPSEQGSHTTRETPSGPTHTQRTRHGRLRTDPPRQVTQLLLECGFPMLRGDQKWTADPST